MTKQYTVTEIAQLTHEVNRLYCKAIGDNSQKPWNKAPQWQQDSARQGVEFLLWHPKATPESSHKNWLKHKKAEGWKHGTVKDEKTKTHPCMVPYNKLPEEQKVKDYLFHTIVRGMEGLL